MSPARAHSRRAWDFGRVSSALLAGLVVFLSAPRVAHAGDIEDFQAARSIYEAHDWRGAIAAFEVLVGGDTPTLQSLPLVLESRQYLATAYLFMGRERAAADQLERLLTEDPTYQLDATQFPREVVQLFERVQTRLRERREAEAEQARLVAELDRLRAENETMRAELSGERSVLVPRSQWLIQIPFGVGQFENGEEGLGWFFLVTEALAAVGALTTTIVHLGYIGLLQDNSRGVSMALWDYVNDALDIVAPFNWSFLGAFGVLAIAGVVQANLAFTPTRTVHLPAGAPPPALAPSVSLLVSPGFVGLAGTF